MTQKNKVLGFKDITLYTVSAMLFMDQIAMAASLGASSLFWWGYVLIFLFIPLAMITAELGTTYPQNGGIYQWVRRAFGFRWGARVSWIYWITTALWMPSVYILFAGMLSELFFPGLSMWHKVFIGIGLAFLTTMFNIVSLNVGKWMPNLGAILKVVSVLALGIAGVRYGLEHGFANPLTLDSILPSSGLEVAALGIMIYGVVGIELACCSGDEMANPKRDIPRAIFVSGLLIACFNIFGTLGVIAAVPADQTDITQIFVHSLYNLYGTTGIGFVVATLVGCFVLFTFITNMVTWSMGANRAAIEASEAGEFPKVFGIVHKKYKTPVGSTILCGVLSTVILLIAGFMAENTEEMFWALMSMTAMIFLMPYIILMFAFVKLRLTDDTERPFRAPVSNFGAIAIAIFVSLNMLAGILMFVYVPGEPVDWGYCGQFFCVIALALGCGELMIRACDKNKKTQSIEQAPLLS